MIQKPKQQGWSSEKKVYADIYHGDKLKTLHNNRGLGALVNDYNLFTYAPLVLYGQLMGNPVQEFINENNIKDGIRILSLSKPILHLSLRKEANNPFDNKLWAVRKDLWFELSMHLGTLGIIDRDRRQFTRVLCQEFNVLDVERTENNTIHSAQKDIFVPITCFSADCSYGCYAIQPVNNLFLERPYIKKIPPLADTVKLAAGIFSDNPNPYDKIQPYPWEEANGNNLV